MRKVKYLKILGLALALFGFSGCGTGYIDGATLTKKGMPVGMSISGAATGKVKDPYAKMYKDENNIRYKCSLQHTVHAAATKALKNGYNYFSITYTKGSNKSPLPINTVDKITKYCDSNYYDEESDLLDDKCAHIGLGSGTPAGFGAVKIYFYKNRNPFVPLWDAKKVLRDVGSDFSDICWGGDNEAYRKALSYYENNFPTKDIDD